MNKAIISLTDAAAARVKAVLAQSDPPALGVRISIGTTGCNGMSYEMEYATERNPADEMIEAKGVTVFIDPMATMFILGTELDYVEEKLESRFVFNNPNETARCGCGESFSV